MIKIIGVYCIENVINNKKYIGCSTQIKVRWQNHKRLLKANKHENCHLQEEYNQYGENAFDYYIIEECPVDNLTEREIYWIKYFDSKNSGYNLTDGGGGLSNPPDDIKKKISEGLKGEKNGMYGVHLKGALNGNYGRHHSDSAKKKMSESKKKLRGVKSPHRRPVQASTGEIFPIMLEAVKWAGLQDGSSIGKCCKGVSKTAGRHPITNEPLTWKYRDDLK